VRVTDETAATLRVRVQPRASSNEVTGWKDGVLCVRITAPPVEGAANKAVVAFVAERLGVKRARVTLVSGGKSRDKVLSVEGLSPEEVAERLGKG
jgi:uncharacterized protein (TIGR00251 family)